VRYAATAGPRRVQRNALSTMVGATRNLGPSDPCPLTCTLHAICPLAMRNERACRRRLNWPIYFPPTRWPRPPWPKRVTPAAPAPPPRSVGTQPARSSAPAPDTPCATSPNTSHTAASSLGRQGSCTPGRGGPLAPSSGWGRR
jgi:hypothetical protein